MKIFKNTILSLELKTVLLITGFVLAFHLSLSAQTIVSASPSYDVAVHELSRWFDSATGFQINLGQRRSDNWDLSMEIGHLAFKNTKSIESSFMQDLDLSLEITRFWASGAYRLAPGARFEPLLLISGGPLYWKGIRGPVLPDAPLGLPAIPAKTLEEWNMGFAAGAGLRLGLGALELEPRLIYTFVPGSLWPTMQEYVELESVNSFQFLSFRLTVNYLF